MIPPSPHNSDQTKILLVENDPIDQLAFTRYVKKSGLSYDYTIASSLSEALKLLNHQSFEVAILDYNLGDGFSNELFPLLRELNCPFIISTGSGDEEIAATLMNEGASDYLIKDPERNYLKVLPVTVSKTLARQKSEQQLRLLSHAMEQVKDSAYIIDEEGKLLFVNEALRSLCNLGQENLIGQSIESLGQPQLIEQILPVNSHPLLPVEYEWFSDAEISITKRDGSEASMLLSQSFIEDGTRRIRVGLMHDITLIKQVELSLLLTHENLERRVHERTAKLQAANQSLELEIQERKQAEALLKASEQRYATLAAAAPVGIFHADPLGKCTYVNECWCQIAGITASAAMGEGWAQALHPEDRDKVADEWYRSTQANRPFHLEYRFLRSDSTIKWVFGQSNAEFDGEGRITGYIGTITDISDRKKSEADILKLNQTLEARVAIRTQELLERESQLRDFFDNATDLIQSVAPDGKILLVNQAWKRTLGYDDRELENLSIFQIIHPDDLCHCQTAMNNLFDGNQCFGLETRFLAKDGRVINVEGNVNCQWENGEAIATRGIFRDVTERKKADKALHESQIFLQTVLNTFPLFVFWKDCQSVYLGCNQNFANSAGLASSSEIIGKTEFDLPWSQTEAKKFIDDDRQVIDSGIPKLNIIETQYKADGEVAWVETNKVPLRNLQNEVIGVLGIYQDITDRKLAEQALAESEAFNRQLIEEFPIGLASCNTDGKLIYVNKAFAAILGYSVEEILQLSYWDITPPKYADLEAEQLQKIYQEGRYGPYEKEYIHRDGHLVPVILNGLLIYQKGEILVWSSIQDISCLKLAESELQSMSYRLELAIKSAQIGIWEWDLSSDRLIWDARMHELYGVSTSDFSGSFKDWADSLHPDDLEASIARIQQAVRGERDFDMEFRLLRKDGSIRHIQAYALAQRDEQGQVQRMIGINYDISDRKQAEELLVRTNEELSHATKLKDEFLANMSHELRTPLNAILGMSESLQDEIFGKINSEQTRAVQLIERSGIHLLELINDILDVSKIESGQVTLDIAPCNVANLFHASLAFIKQQALRKSIQVEIQMPPHLPDLLVDERRIRQVLINLLNNAVKFTPDGGSLTLEVTRKDKINAPQESPQSFLQISVIDTGIGISSENIKKLFQPFIQIDSALNRQYQGTGLGLALVKRVVELHGGIVSLSSEVGVGSRFTIELPCVDENRDLIELNSLPTSTKFAQNPFSFSESSPIPLILLAEDNEANIMTMVSYLSTKGYRFVTAHNGEEAIALAQSEKPNLIIMDIQMPVMDGLDSIQQIRQIPSLMNTPIVALTALAMPEDRDRCITAGATEYIHKPVKLKQLAATIHQLLEQPVDQLLEQPLEQPVDRQ